jgi:hypothetical protein
MNVFVDQSYFIDALGADWTQRVLAPYREWTGALPQPLASVHASLIGQEIGNSNLVHFPWLFGEPFEAGEDLVEWLVAANAFMLTYFLASDRMFDAPETADRATILLATLLHAELLRYYDRVAPANAAPIWQRLIRDHVDGVMAEEQHHAAVRAGAPGLSLAAYEQTSMRKNRYGMAAIELLAARTRQPEMATLLRRVYDHMAIEIEFDDDLKDWQEDLQAGRFTPTVQLLVEAAGSSRTQDVTSALVTSPAVPDILDRIDAHLAAAQSLLHEATFPHLRLTGWLARHREANRRLRTFVIGRQVSTALGRSLAR